MVFLLVSPITMYLWNGRKVEDEIKNCSLSIIKAFLQENQPDRLVNEPSYMTLKRFSETTKIRLEWQGYESQ